VAIGGLAVGYYAFGGGGAGVHSLMPAVHDPEAQAFFMPWALAWTRWMVWLSVAFPVAWVALFLWIRWRLTPRKPPTTGEGEPRFSRKAIWGAVWSALAVVTVLSMTVVTTVERSGAAMANAGPPAGAPTSVQIIIGLLALVGAAAPFGTTILGVVSIGEIRRSQGRIYGLPLSVADAVLFPLLLLDFAILGAVYFVVGRIGGSAVSPVLLVVVLAGIVWIDFLIARAAWRAAAGIRPENYGEGRQIVPTWTWLALGLAVAMFAIVSAVSGWVDGLVWAPIVWLGAHGLGLVWNDDERLDRRAAKGVVLATWSVACVAVYFVLWLPVQDGPHWTQAAGAIGYFDRHYWPWHGEAECMVSLKPAEPTFRRLSIENRRTIDRDGIGLINWDGVSSPRERTRDEFELRLDRLDDKPAPRLLVDGRAGMAWRIVDAGGSETKGNHPFDEEAAARWFRAAEIKTDDPAVKDQITALTAVVREAIERDTSTGFAWSGLERTPVGYLEFIVNNQTSAWRMKSKTPEKNTYPFSERLGTITSSYRRVWPLVPIGVGVMLAVWGAGAWALGRRYTPSNSSAPQAPPAARILMWAGGIQVIGSIATALLAAGLIVDDYHFDAFFRSDAGRIPSLIAQTIACLAGVSAVVGGLAMATGGGESFARATAYGLLPPITPTWLISCPLAVWVLKLTANSPSRATAG
jgi:hypothetical protein